jgi:hypothetical protein
LTFNGAKNSASVMLILPAKELAQEAFCYGRSHRILRGNFTNMQMNYSIGRRLALCGILGLTLAATSCKDDEESAPVVTVANFEKTVDENLPAGTELGTLEATTNKGEITYLLQSQSVAGAIAIDETSGKVTVADASKFDFEASPLITAVVNAKNGATKSPITVSLHLQKVIWTGPIATFTKASNADWTLAANQDKITDLVTLTRQAKGPIYNYQFWMDTFDGDATFTDLEDDFWNNENSLREFVNVGGTAGVRWAILDSPEVTNEAWDTFELYGTLGDPTHFYSLHNVASIITNLDDNIKIVGIPNDFDIEFEGGDIEESAGTYMPGLVGKKLAIWLVEEDIYLTFEFTSWGSEGSNQISWMRSTMD